MEDKEKIRLAIINLRRNFKRITRKNVFKNNHINNDYVKWMEKKNFTAIELLNNLRTRIHQRRNVGRNANEDTKSFDIYANDLGKIIDGLTGNVD